MKYEIPKGYRKFFTYKIDEKIIVLANRKGGSAVFIFDGISKIPVEIYENHFKYKTL